ncbi:MAG TPA: helix-turn-helix domain-containing protein [Chloroflexota bacterium]|nr:helix-turn-helix domain-containing protein [Chloroflexota bacterium]
MAAVFGDPATQSAQVGGGATAVEGPRGRLGAEDFSRYLERVTTIHSRLSRMVLDDEGIEALVVTLSHLLSRPVVVQDRFFKLLAASEGAEDDLASAEVFEDPKVADRVKKIVQEHRPAEFPPFPELGMRRARVMAPIVVGSEMAGYLSILANERPIEDMDFTTAEHAATVLALEVMKERTAFEVENRLKGSFTEDLLSGNYADERSMTARARHLGYNLAQQYHLLLVEPDEPQPMHARRKGEPEGSRLRADLEEIVQGFVQKSAPGSIVASRGQGVVVLVPEAFTGPTQQAIEGLAQNLHARVVQVLSEVPISIGAGRLCKSIPDFKESFQEARRALDIIRRCHKRNQVIFFHALGVYRLFSLIEDRVELMQLAEQTLGPLLEYDGQHSTSLVRTLGYYLESGRNLETSARAMYIHVNTLKYRLKRIQEIARLDINDAEQRFNVHLAVKILQAIGHNAEL